MDTSPPVVLRLPFRGRWQARNSPARRVPSHGTHLFGTTYAIDFVPVDDRGLSAPLSWRTVLAIESPDAFVGFGAPVLAPLSGTVVATHDGEPDHAAYRSPAAAFGYALGQPRRVRAGAPAIAGNHVVIAANPGGPFVLLAHLQQGSLRYGPGDAVMIGTPIGSCGNSGNSTEPHVHIQVSDCPRGRSARGLPMAFRRLSGAGTWMPGEGEIVDAGSPG